MAQFIGAQHVIHGRPGGRGQVEEGDFGNNFMAFRAPGLGRKGQRQREDGRQHSVFQQLSHGEFSLAWMKERNRGDWI